MKYIKLFEDHTTDQPENSVEQVKAELASIAKGTFKYAAIDAILDNPTNDEMYEPNDLKEFNEKFSEILIWICDNLGISTVSQSSVNMKRLSNLGVMSPFEFVKGIDFGNIVTLWDDASYARTYKYQEAAGPVQMAKLRSIFPNLIKAVPTGAANEMNINGFYFLCLPEPYTVIHKNLELNTDSDYGDATFIHATIGTSMGLTFINIEMFEHNMFFVKL